MQKFSKYMWSPVHDSFPTVTGDLVIACLHMQGNGDFNTTVMPGENCLSIISIILFKPLGSSVGLRATNCLKSIGCGAKRISDICFVGFRDRKEVEG